MSVDVIENFLASDSIEYMRLIIIFYLNGCKSCLSQFVTSKLSQSDHALLGLKALLLVKYKVAQAVGY